MKTKVTAVPDVLSRDRFQEMLASKSFALFTAKIAGELERARQACERLADPVELNRAQGAVLAWRSMLRFPDVILEEMKKPPA